VRLDQWLWAVRLYRTRTLAAAAVKAGQVAVDGLSAKPARTVHPGERISARTGDITRIYRVLGEPPSRVGARHVPEFAEDLTPPSELETRMGALMEQAYRPKGEGRPTKRDRRRIERWTGSG
jgi:ribosome-associated heat shock protein Hsp15